MKHPNDINPKDILGIVKFMGGTKEEFLKKAGELVIQLKDKTRVQSETEKQSWKSVFGDAEIDVYVFGTVQGEERNEIWFVRSGGELTGSGEVKKEEIRRPAVLGGRLTSTGEIIQNETEIDSPALTEWLNTVTEERYDLASVLEKLLRHSTGGTNHKMLIDKFIHNNLTVVPADKLEAWKEFQEQAERARVKQEEKDAELMKIKADPNYEKYAEEIGRENGYKIGDQFFPQMFYLHKMLEETPKEELDKLIAEVDASNVGSESPTVDEYFQMLNPSYMHQKGYSEGAKALADKVTERLANDERPVIPIAEVIALIGHIYNTE